MDLESRAWSKSEYPNLSKTIERPTLRFLLKYVGFTLQSRGSWVTSIIQIGISKSIQIYSTPNTLILFAIRRIRSSESWVLGHEHNSNRNIQIYPNLSNAKHFEFFLKYLGFPFQAHGSWVTGIIQIRISKSIQIYPAPSTSFLFAMA